MHMGAMLRLLPMEYFRMIPGFCSALVAPERAMPDGVAHSQAVPAARVAYDVESVGLEPGSGRCE